VLQQETLQLGLNLMSYRRVSK